MSNCGCPQELDCECVQSENSNGCKEEISFTCIINKDGNKTALDFPENGTLEELLQILEDWKASYVSSIVEFEATSDDGSIDISPSGTLGHAPDFSVNISEDAGNALSLHDDGLYASSIDLEIETTSSIQLIGNGTVGTPLKAISTDTLDLVTDRGAITTNNITVGSLISSNDSTINGLNIGKGNSSVASNTAFGLIALNANTTGTGNSAIGYNSLKLNTLGSSNSALGSNALPVNTIGSNNSSFGEGSLKANTTGSYNTAIGQESLKTNISGNKNTAIGEKSGYVSIGDSNVFIGYKAGYAETGSNKLIIANSDTDSIIEGNFTTKKLNFKGGINIASVPVYADNAAATTAGLVNGDVYRTGDILKIKHA